MQGPASRDRIVRADLNVKDTWKILLFRNVSVKQVYYNRYFIFILTIKSTLLDRIFMIFQL